MKKFGQPIEQDGETGYVATNVLFMAMQKAKTVTDTAKIVAAMEGMKYQLTKGPEDGARLRPPAGAELPSRAGKGDEGERVGSGRYRGRDPR